MIYIEQVFKYLFTSIFKSDYWNGQVIYLKKCIECYLYSNCNVAAKQYQVQKRFIFRQKRLLFALFCIGAKLHYSLLESAYLP